MMNPLRSICMNEMPFYKKILATLLNKKRLIIIGCILVVAATFGYIGIWYLQKPEVILQRLTIAPEEVKGKIITLKRLKEEYFIDYHNMFSNIVRENLEFPKVTTLAWTIRYLKGEMSRDQFNNKKMVMYCIFDNKANKLVGALEIRDKDPSDPGQIGAWINENYWGGGRFSEAVRLISQVYFALKPEEKSYICHIRLWNKRSYHAFKKFGFKEVGYYHEHGEPSRHILELHREQVMGKVK